MFKSALVKLTAAYLVVLILLSLFFSALVFGVASREIKRSFNRPMLLQELKAELPGPKPGRPVLEDLLDARVQDGRKALALNLIYLNLAIVVVGGGASYWLARWTLRPIERSHQAQSRFAADASHELRTPLTAMRTEIEVALADPKLDLEGAKKQLRSNLEELDKLGSLTQGLLRLARIDSEGLRANLVEVADTVRESIKRVSLAAKQKKIVIDFTQNADVAATIKGDRAGLIELFVILLDNAIKYTPESGRVSVYLAEQSGDVLVSVQDQGPGISPEQLPYIFERFYRADSARSKSVPGLGLGLSIARSLADLHSAKITVQNIKPHGTRFSVGFNRA